ncbi:hypothetical protein BX265_8370 [Streptomyces sp. TLI_235]|nr:hypothetical protein [Streptomyces sp. TLI_235]PBC66305.1 hypothetical protein BX265_8370 [Streptomyces sp. TLI_235]
MHTDTEAGPAPNAGARLPAQRTPNDPTPADNTTSDTSGAHATDTLDSADGDAQGKTPSRLGMWFTAQAARTATGARSIGAVLVHWASTGDQGNEEIRRRLVLAQLEAHTERRDEAQATLATAAKKVVRLEEDAVDGLTQAQRRQLVLGRETVRRLEKTLKDLRKAQFLPVQPTDRQIDRARGFAKLRRGALLVTVSIATVLLAVHRPQAGLLGLLAATGLAWWTGDHPPRLMQRPVPEELLLPELALPTRVAGPADTEPAEAENEPPFSIHDAADAETAAECVRRALAAEGLAIGEITGVSPERWGWRTVARLSKGKPGDLVAKLPNLDVRLGVRQGGVMAQPQKEAAASVVLRIITSNAFDPMPPHPVYAPRSNTVKKPMTLGPSMDGVPTQITLAGQNILIVASPGGGKSAIIRSLVDYVTSCTDAFVWDIDPTGRGLGPLRRLADRRAYTEKDIDEALDDAIAYAKARAELMGDDVDNWPVTDTSPAGFVFVDEHPQLTSKQKAKVIALMRIGRKARFTVALASQDATADVVGDAVADAFGIRIMLPCRRADVPLVVGSDTAISEGWMPHRLTPSPGDWDLADAGCFYIVAPGLADPILRKATFMTADDAKRRAGERFAAGLATVDPATVGGQVATDLPEPPAVLTVLREAFAAEDGATCLPLGRLHPHLAAADPARWDRWQDKAEQDRLREIGKALATDLRRAEVDLSTVRLDDLDGSPRGIRLDDLKAVLRHYA